MVATRALAQSTSFGAALVAGAQAQKPALMGALGLASASSMIDLFGDSQTALENVTPSATILPGTSARGSVAQALAQLKGRLHLGSNFGVAGDTTTQMLARIATALASPNKRVVIRAGTNDIANLQFGGASVTSIGAIGDAQSAGTLMGNLFGTVVSPGIVLQFLLAGFEVYWCTILPRGGWGSYTTPQATIAKLQILAVNQMIRRICASYPGGNLVLVDQFETVVDASSATGDLLSTAFNADLIHQVGYGAALMAGPLVAAITTRVPPAPRRVVAGNDTYDATNNPTGALNSNPVFLGATNGTAGGGASGTIPAGYSLARTGSGTTITAAGAIVNKSGATGGKAMQITLGGGTGGLTNERMRLFASTINAGGSTFAAGDIVYLEVEIDQAALVNVQNIGVQVIHNDGTTAVNAYGLQWSQSTTDREPASNSRRLATVPFVVPAYSGTGTQILVPYLVIDADCSGAGVSGTITVNSFALRKVIG